MSATAGSNFWKWTRAKCRQSKACTSLFKMSRILCDAEVWGVGNHAPPVGQCPMDRQLWSIGHSTKPIDEFLALLQSHGIRRLVDVRTVPRSRHNPQFDTDTLAKHLKDARITYQHQPSLGGLRKPQKDSINAGWKNTSFRGYADYMQTEAFWA